MKCCGEELKKEKKEKKRNFTKTERSSDEIGRP